jgi:hypothetical protein
MQLNLIKYQWRMVAAPSAIEAVADAIRDGHKREDREHMDELHTTFDQFQCAPPYGTSAQ